MLKLWPSSLDSGADMVVESARVWYVLMALWKVLVKISFDLVTIILFVLNQSL